MSDVLERVRKIVIEHLDADPEKVTEKASFIDDLGADSLDNVELVMAFEEEFDIEIPDDAAEHIQTVGDAVKFIAERVKKIVVEHLGVDESKVTENASFIDDLGADSLDTVELVMAFEEEFGCEIPDDAAEKILTVKDAINFIEARSK